MTTRRVITHAEIARRMAGAFAIGFVTGVFFGICMGLVFAG